MTKNQGELLRFLGEYRMKHGNSPTLREIASGIDVSDNKSALGIIKNLIKQGYLTKDEKKSRSILLTDKAITHIGLNVFTTDYKKILNPSDAYLKSPKLFDVKGVSVSMPTRDTTRRYLGKNIDTSGSSLNDIQSIVEIAVNFVLSNFSNGTLTSQREKTILGSSFYLYFSKILENTSFPEKFSWSLILIFLSTFCISTLGKDIISISTSIVYVFVIFVILKLSK